LCTVLAQRFTPDIAAAAEGFDGIDRQIKLPGNLAIRFTVYASDFNELFVLFLHGLLLSIGPGFTC
jgi:hypothetical protein